MFNDPLIDGHESPADFNDEIQAEADSGLPDREVIETMKCFMCEWTGHPDDLVAITDEPESINDFVHCPICKCNVWEEEETPTYTAEDVDCFASIYSWH